jgi:hypothetical protein
MPAMTLFERGTTSASPRESPSFVESLSRDSDSAIPNLGTRPQSHPWNLVATSGDPEGKAVHG